MATVLTAPETTAETLYVSFPVEKWERDDSGDLVVTGVATDPSVDSDLQIVDSSWSAKSLSTWLETGGNVRMSHDPQRPVGKGLQVVLDRDGDGKHRVKSVIVDPLAQKLVEKGVLTAYSIGIARPIITRDPSGRAPGGIICGGDVCELSIVDRPSNKSAYLELAKADDDGKCEFTGKMYGAGADLLTKSVSVDLPPDVSVSFSPSDLKKLLDHRKAAEARAATEKAAADKAAAEADAAKGELSAADRASLPASSFAFVDSNGDGHLPVHDEGHVRSALGRFGQQQFPDAKSKRRAARKIVSRAHSMGIDVDSGSDVARAAGKLAEPDHVKAGAKCGLCKGKGTIRGGKLECPRCHGDGSISMGEPDEHGEGQDDDAKGKTAEAEAEKSGARDCPDCGKGHDADSPSKFCADCGHKLPAMSGKDADPELVKAGAPSSSDSDDDQDDDSGDDGEDGPDDASSGGSDDDDPDDEDDDAKGKTAEPDAEKAAAAPMPAAKPKVPCPSCGKQVKASMAFCGKCGGSMKASAEKAAGKPTPDGGAVGEHLDPVPAHREPDGPYIESLEHDAKLPTDPDGPYIHDTPKAASARIDALGVPYPLGALHDHLCPAYAPGLAAKAHPGYGTADIDLADWMEKALTAAASAPLEEAAASQLLWQHAATIKALDPQTAAEVSADLHKAFADANPGPGTFPTPAELTPQRFRRPYITAGHAAPSPQQDGPNTAAIPPAGGISATDYTRGYLDAGRAADSPSNKDAHMAPGASNGGRVFYRNTSRQDARTAMAAMHDHIARTFPDLCPMSGEPDHGSSPNPLPMPAGSSKAAEADAPAEKPRKAEKTARQHAKAPDAPAAAAVNEDRMTREEALAWLASDPSAAAVIAKAAGTAAIASPDVVKAAVADAVSPLLAELAATRAQLDGQAEVLEAQAKAQRKANKMLDAIAGQPDPNGPYRGAPLQQFPAEKAMAPSVLSPAEAAQRAQQQVYEELHRTWRESPDATARLAAEDAMAKMRGIPSGGLIAH